MRISDWSSDVCSSDLRRRRHPHADRVRRRPAADTDAGRCRSHAMSYILDALRRAERERDTGKAPSVESLNRGVTEVERARVPPRVCILAIATTVIAGAALAILLWPHTPPSSAQGEAPPTPRPVVQTGRA